MPSAPPRPAPCLPPLSPELGLLVSLARSKYRDEEAAITARLSGAQGAIDWPAFLALMAYHRLAAPVHDAVSRLPRAPIPGQVRETIRRAHARNAQAALRAAAETVRAAELLGSRGIRVLACKGQVLAQTLHGRIGARHAGDVDVLADPERLFEADAALCAAGYARSSPEVPLTAAQWRIYRRRKHHFGYRSPLGVELELHYRLFPNPRRLPLPFEELWSRSREVELAGRRLRTFSEDDTLLHLVMHGALSGWLRLFWLLDVAEIRAREGGGPAWERLERRAAALGLARPVALAGLLLEAAMGRGADAASILPRPPDPLTREAMRIMLGPDPLTSLPQKLRYCALIARLQPGLACALHDMAHKLLPDDLDFRAVPLPDILIPLYIPLRPFLWLARRCAGKPK